MLNRRTFLKGAGVLGAASLAGPVISKDWAFAKGPLGTPATPIEHIVIDCQENRSFDHYFGYASFAGSFGPPAGYSQPDGSGGSLELASRNHLFDVSTPGGGNYEAANGAATGPPAPPRDALGSMGDLTECFTF